MFYVSNSCQNNSKWKLSDTVLFIPLQIKDKNTRWILLIHNFHDEEWQQFLNMLLFTFHLMKDFPFSISKPGTSGLIS